MTLSPDPCATWTSDNSVTVDLTTSLSPALLLDVFRPSCSTPHSTDITQQSSKFQSPSQLTKKKIQIGHHGV